MCSAVCEIEVLTDAVSSNKNMSLGEKQAGQGSAESQKTLADGLQGTTSANRRCHQNVALPSPSKHGGGRNDRNYRFGQNGIFQDGLPLLKAFHRVLFECWVSRRVGTRTNKLSSIGQIVRSQEQFSESFGNRKFSCFLGWWRIKFR